MRDNKKGGALTETTFLILLSVTKTRHGYGMMKFIEQETHGRVALGAGTLYGAIETLLKKGWIRPVETGAEHGKKEYLLTETGRKIAGAESARLSELEKLARRILGGEAS
ncbi:MAG TPA: PadR family transcriptional regulator [Ruminococcaceae bacterium]|nr:PadR family transcriptional regulator [Oscillospiraceae bacterium]